MSTSIREVLDEAGIIYRNLNLDKEEENEETEINTYLIKLLINNVMVSGGIAENNKNKMITILFFYNIAEYEEEVGELKILQIINELNQVCKFGNFTYESKDITFSFFLPIIGSEEISKSVFEYYFKNCLSVVKDAFEEIFDELRENNN